ncbi:hypothetical protein LCGC14_1719730 [marine sediment metagenome]|uniref:SGNH/GDSL hydrolase family protein n=1 Tax=marine sediment metagenome TaxID=412755 RepID=A0A0F9I0I2_9ZZZZ
MVKKKVIYCIGDSHTLFFTKGKKERKLKELPDKLLIFKIFTLRKGVAYNLCQWTKTPEIRNSLFNVLEKEVPPKSKVLLSFGEIDCRFHLYRQSKIQNVTTKDIVKECVDRYFSAALEVRKMGFEIFVWNVVPSRMDTRHIGSVRCSHAAFGSCKERNQIAKQFNNYLRKKCYKENIIFLSIFNNIIKDRKKLRAYRKYFLHDLIHLNKKALPFLAKEISKYI